MTVGTSGGDNCCQELVEEQEQQLQVFEQFLWEKNFVDSHLFSFLGSVPAAIPSRSSFDMSSSSSDEHDSPAASTSALPEVYEERPNTTFAALGVEPFLVRALEAMSIRAPTGVQAACIPPILSGKCLELDSERWKWWRQLIKCVCFDFRCGLHWKCPDWIWKDCSFCHPNLTGLVA